MINVFEEIIEHTTQREQGQLVKCIELNLNGQYYYLKEGYTVIDFGVFINTTNKLEYDNGYGGQELFGIIWYVDGTWSERGEYDGSEWWRHQSCPVVPDYLKE